MSARGAADGARPRISWHRGGAELAPFATLSAFSSAAAHGAELIEVDVRRTADGTLVCVHDPEVPGVGRIDQVAWSAVGPASAGSPRAGAGRVFALAEFLDALDEHDPARTSEIHLDLKETGYEGAAVAAVLGRSRRLVVTSLEEGSIEAVRSAYPSVPALLTLGRDGRHLRRMERLRLRASELAPFGRVARCGATGVAAHHLLAGPWLRRWCTSRGMQLLVWTVDSDRALERWLGRRDVDVVTTNRPLAAIALRDGDSAP